MVDLNQKSKTYIDFYNILRERGILVTVGYKRGNVEVKASKGDKLLKAFAPLGNILA